MQPIEDKGEWLGVDVSGRQPVVRQATSSVGHNSRHLELDKIVTEAVRGLKFVEEGEAKVIEGWIIYGAALNVGREKFDGDLEFGQWIALCQLDTADRHDRSAAMWAEENTDLMYEIMEDNPRIKTVRGAHAKYKLTLKEEEEEPPSDTDGDTESVPPKDDKPWNTENPDTTRAKGKLSTVASSIFGVLTNVQLFEETNGEVVDTVKLTRAILSEINIQGERTDEEIQGQVNGLRYILDLLSNSLPVIDGEETNVIDLSTKMKKGTN